MPVKVKRTYNLSPEVVAITRRLAERHVAPSQDAVVEQAIRELDRLVRNGDEAEAWARAVTDPEFQAEARQFDELFALDDAAAWPT